MFFGKNPAAFIVVIALMVVVMLGRVHAQQAESGNAPQLAPEVDALIERVRLAPNDGEIIEAARYIGFDLLRQRRYAEAAEVFSRINTASPDDPKTLYGNALALFNLRQLDEAEKLALGIVNDATPRAVAKQQAVNASNVTADALVLLGVIRAVRLDNAGALRYTQRAVALAPDNFDAHLALGRAFYGAGDPANAAAAFRQAIKLNSTDVRARFFLATALEKANDLDGALAAYRQLLQVAPQNADGHLGLGVLLVKQGGTKVDEGIQTLTRAVNLNGDLYEARITLGRALVRAGRAAESVEHLQRAAALAPGNPEPRYQLAIAYRKLGKKIEAEEESRIVKQLHEARRGTNDTANAPKPN